MSNSGNQMTSEKQRKANRANSRKSTGPRTARGKEVSSRNFYKHGLTAISFPIGEEDHTEFESFRERLQIQFDSQCEIFCVLVDQLASQLWRLRRVPMLEAAIIDAAAR
jgi:hypothetical protein